MPEHIVSALLDELSQEEILDVARNGLPNRISEEIGDIEVEGKVESSLRTASASILGAEVGEAIVASRDDDEIASEADFAREILESWRMPAERHGIIPGTQDWAVYINTAVAVIRERQNEIYSRRKDGEPLQ